MFPAGQVHKASRAVYEMSHAINYRQTRSDDRFSLVKMNLTGSRNHES